MVGGMRLLRIVISEATASTAPAADQGVADHRLVRRDRDARHALAEHGRAAHGFHLVVLGRRGAMGVDVVDLVRRKVGIGERVPDGRDDRRAVRARPGAVEIRRPSRRSRAVAEDRAPRALAVSAFSSTSAAPPSPMHETVAVLGEGLRRRLPGSRSGSRGRTAARSAPAIPGSPSRRCRCKGPHRVSPRRIASTPSWIAVAPEEQAVDREIGEPLVPNSSATGRPRNRR